MYVRTYVLCARMNVSSCNDSRNDRSEIANIFGACVRACLSVCLSVWMHARKRSFARLNEYLFVHARIGIAWVVLMHV